MKLKTFQKQDLARAALKDGLILSWDTGLGKTWALFLWSLLKVGYEQVPAQYPGQPEKVRPKAPVLIVAPGDLHQQISDEGLTHFGVVTHKMDCQETFQKLTRQPGSALTNLDENGRPILAPGFYVTSYTQLTTNGVEKLPDPLDWSPRALLAWLCLSLGEHQEPQGKDFDRRETRQLGPMSFTDVCNFFAWRGVIWRDAYDVLYLHPESTQADLDHNYEREVRGLESWHNPKEAGAQRSRLQAAFDIVKNLVSDRRNPRFTDLTHGQQDWVIRQFLIAKVAEYETMNGEAKGYPIGEPPEGFDPQRPETDARPKRFIKCVYSPSLADLAYNAFDCVVIDEGVRMKGEDTLVGKGVRSMTPKSRLVLTATPVKNRLPDIFRLAWWATGGKPEAHARFPYRDDSSERTKFAETFMVSERNLTKEAEAAEQGKKTSGGRFKKLTAEVCNVHRLWKLFGPIILRRRKQDTGLDIVPKIRKVIRCEMGTQQKRVYRYHLDADYRDKNGQPAIGAQLQALRIAAADPASDHLTEQPGGATEACECLQADVRPRFCPKCGGKGYVTLPARSGTKYIPKLATALALIEEVLGRKEQVIVFSAFNDPLDNLSQLLKEAGVRHVILDGRVNQKRRGEKAALFKKGRVDEFSIPVMLAGVECMAEGHSFHLANNVILVAYSWAADKFKQALDRVHRLNSVKPVNVYVILCQGTIDRRLESLTDEKTDAAELVLDGRLIGERSEEVNLAELLKVAKREFNAQDNTLDEATLQSQWPRLRDRLGHTMRQWDLVGRPPQAPTHSTPTVPLTQNHRAEILKLFMTKPEQKQRLLQSTADMPPNPPDNIIQLKQPEPYWKVRAKERTHRLAQRKRDPWGQL